ncbi:MAG: ABC transporter substrate-binding protein [Faecousia sp.]
MKKTFSMLLAVLLLLCGCGAEAPVEPKLTRVGFSQLGAESDWRVANTDSMMQAFSEENGYELLYDNARQKQANQLVAVRNFIVQGVDIIVIAPAEETGWDTVLQEAKNAGIPVIIVDREVAVEDTGLYLTQIGSDFLAEGLQAVNWLEETLADRREEVNILHIQGTYGATAQILRSKAIEDAVQCHENWQFAAQLSGDFTESKGYEVVRDYLAANRDIDVIYSENDNMTFGAMQALDEAGITYGEGGDVIIISFDAVRRALQDCMAGKINLCVECNPLHGPRVDELIRQYFAGQSIPKQIFVEETVFTPDMLTPEFIDARQY